MSRHTPATRRLSFFAGITFLLAGCGMNELQRLTAEARSADMQVRRQAVQQLLEHYPQAEELTAILQSGLSDSDREIRRMSCIGLGNAGKEHAEQLSTLLQDRELSVQIAAAFGILKHDQDHSEAIRTLEGVMKQGDGGVIVAVTKAGENAVWAVPTFIELLKDRRPGIRRLAAEGLGKIGPPARTAIPQLKKAEHDSDDRVRLAATKALHLVQ